MLETLAKMEYPGRFIIIGRDEKGENNITVYGITGRSTSSQARKLEDLDKHGVVRVNTTDRKVLENGNPSLLLYEAMFFYDSIPKFANVDKPEFRGPVVGVSNGAQTKLIYNVMKRRFHCRSIPGHVLAESLNKPFYEFDPQHGWVNITSYEPDEPNWTPRISGIALAESYAFYSSVREEDGGRRGKFCQFDYSPGEGGLMSTYQGESRAPLPSFSGPSLEVRLDNEMIGESALEAAEAAYSTLNEEYRVCVAAVFAPLQGGEFEVAIVNRHDESTEEKEKEVKR